MESHDSIMPLHFAMKGKRCIENKNAIAYEKAGESIKDEFKRKVRMNRLIMKRILPSLRILNIFRYKWFTLFYLGHRTSRYLLWLSHLLILISSIFLAKSFLLFQLITFIQAVIFLLVIIQQLLKTKFRLLVILHYYFVTILAQWIAVLKTITRKNKPFWENVKSTR
jgi:hypothetical protein